MLDTFEILTTSGVVLWSRSYAPVKASVINSFIVDTFIEEKCGPIPSGPSPSAATNPPYKTDHHTLRWTLVKELGVIFVAVYRSLLQLSWVDTLVDHVKTIFVGLYGDQLSKPLTTIVECTRFDDYFDQQLQELDESSTLDSSAPPYPGLQKHAAVPPPDEASAASGLRHRHSVVENGNGEAASPQTKKPMQALNAPRSPIPSGGHLVVAKAGPVAKMSRRARKAKQAGSATASSGDEASARLPKQGAKVPKKGRKWGIDGLADDDENDLQLDYSLPSAGDDGSARETAARSSAVDVVSPSSWGSSSKGKFLLKDLGDEAHSILAEADKAAAAAPRPDPNSGLLGSGLGAVSSLFRNVIGGKTLTEQDLKPAMKGMEEHLLKKNVAREAAVRLCDGVERELLGVKTGSFEGIKSRIQKSMESSLTKMLTPTSSLDLLREIDSVTGTGRPYVISIVGVNGVGKSTNLSKMCFFLLQNRYKVLIAAGDTFRSGAVEQLAVHVGNLKELAAREAAGGDVDLFQRGYGKDAAAVARDAVAHAAADGYHVVLIDTAGRRHNDQRLMASLEKFANFARPDKILMVGEALVGTDSVAQARNFNAAFGPARSLDGFIISKCDTVGDMVGTLVSLVHATGVPILFVGVGQHYSDLRNFSVPWAVRKLLGPD